jgi:hypothetical protein
MRPRNEPLTFRMPGLIIAFKHTADAEKSGADSPEPRWELDRRGAILSEGRGGWFEGGEYDGARSRRMGSSSD